MSGGRPTPARPGKVRAHIAFPAQAMASLPHHRYGNLRVKDEDERLRHRLELQALGIERVFLRHKTPARVAGGTVQSQATSFSLQAFLAPGREHLHQISRELQQALGVRQVAIEQSDGQWQVSVVQPQPAPVELLDLLESLPRVSHGVVALGVAENARPVLLNLLSEESAHVLVSGTAQAGKTSLLRAFAMSLALTNRQSQVQMILMTAAAPPPGREKQDEWLAPLAYLPHVLAHLITNPEEVAGTLRFLAGEQRYRRREGFALPRIILFMDGLLPLLERGGQAVRRDFGALLQGGAQAGIHLVVSTREPQAALDNLLRTYLPVRITGRLDSAAEAWAATGIADSRAQQLLGQGDFLAVAGGSVVRFQGAYISDYDVHLCLDDLHQRRPRTIVAQPIVARLSPPMARPLAARAHDFRFDGQRLALAFAGD